MFTYKVIRVGGLESCTAPRKDAAAGNIRWHRKIVVEQGKNTFAFHLWGEKAMKFAGKVGDRMMCRYRSKVHVSRTGVYHENLTLTDYIIFKPGVKIPAKPWMLDIYRAAHLTEDDLEIVYPNKASEPDGEIGVAGVDYPDEVLDLEHVTWHQPTIDERGTSIDPNEVEENMQWMINDELNKEIINTKQIC